MTQSLILLYANILNYISLHTYQLYNIVHFLHGLLHTMVITIKYMHQLIMFSIVQNGATIDHGNNGFGHWSVTDC